jgi:hypothetical protein
MLFEPERHEALQDAAWDPARARAAIAGIVEDAQATLGAGIGWPFHPLDTSEPEPPAKSVYFGASGVLWALWYLRNAGAVSLRIEPAALIDRVHEAYLAEPDTGEVVPSYFLGEVGILLVRWRLTRARDAADRMYDAIAGNIGNPTNEPLWGAAGTMIAALDMWQWTGEARWRDLYLANAAHLFATWHRSEHAPCDVWTQDMYGRIVQHIGAGHGFAGNAYALLRGAALLSGEQRESLYRRCVETIRVTAKLEGDAANWPPSIGPPRPGRANMLVQWCHGAPGIVTGLADFPATLSADMDAMLDAAGNLVWNAGPLIKGPGLCHGTAGNGYAFLALYQRTGDEAWLARARAFAMHAIAQCGRAREHYGRGRYSLWTGDPGLAVYLWHCLAGSGGLPRLHVLD